jgi:hypothetical protein
MNYRPKLEQIKVPLQKLLLDPNNPRFLEDHAAVVVEKDFADSGVQAKTKDRMQKKAFRVADLKTSIETNGWQPVDKIFVRKLDALPGMYVVLEGNRRVIALRELESEKKLQGELLAAVDPLDVLEVVSADSVEESRVQVTYLLGVRHHGSLKPWGPFAQAHNIYERYLQEGNMTDATFRWNEAVAKKIGERLSVTVKTIGERLRTYVVMKQLNEIPKIKKVGVKGKYYSLVQAALPSERAKSPLRKYVAQDQSTFKVDGESVDRLDKVCHFSAPERKDAPIRSPDEWRPLAKILGDEDDERRAEMLEDVEEGKELPSLVWALRQAELRQPRWDRWLAEVAELIRKLQISNIDSDDDLTRTVGGRLAKVLDALHERTQTSPNTKGV